MMRVLMVTAAAALAVGCAEPSSRASDIPPSEGENTVTAILNAGVMATLDEGEGQGKFLFDPLYDNHFGSLAELDPQTIDAIVAGDPPYDGVDAVFVSHAHGDHFSARHLNRLLAAQGNVELAAPAQAVEAMRKEGSWDDAFDGRIHAIELDNGQAKQSLMIGGVQVDAFRSPHSGWPDRHAEVHNISYRISTPQGRRVMHLGDADGARSHFAAHADLLASKRTGMAVVPFWMFREDDPDRLIDETLNAEAAVGMHVPTAAPAWLGDSDREFFTTKGEQVAVPKTD